MKKVVLFFLIVMSFSLYASQNNIENTVNQSVFQCSSSDFNQTEIQFNLSNYEIDNETINGEEFQSISAKEAGYLQEKGFPELPTFSTTIAIPNKGSFSVEFIGGKNEFINNFRAYPSQGVNLDTEIPEQRGFEINNEFYTGNTNFPENSFKVNEPVILRDYRVINISLNPFTYFPSENKLEINKNAKIVITYNNEPGINEITKLRKPSRSFENLYKSFILNYDQVRDENPDYQPRSILMIQPNNASINSSLNWLENWKRQKGFEITRVTTSETGTSTTQIKNYIQNAYDNWDIRPEYIMLIGDTDGSVSLPTFYENYSYYNGEGDHPYTLLDGNDILGDVFIGRLSVANSTELMTVISKIFLSEKTPNLTDPDIYHHSVLVGDTSPSGLSCVLTNKFIKELIEDHDPEHSFTELYGPDPSAAQMGNAINNGALFFDYRGWIGMSGFGTSNINSLTNYNKLVNAVILTCDTGSFASGDSRSEVFLTAGTPTNPKGGYFGVGMATSGTHTRYNNSLTGGMFQGLFVDNMSTMGEALLRGKLNLYQTYDANHHNDVGAFTHWCNLMGDPSMDIWLTEPIPMDATYESEIDLGVGYIDINVTSGGVLPIENAWVTIIKGDNEIFATDYTDNNGHVLFTFDNEISGDITVTITKPNYVPHIGSFTVSATGGIGYNDVVFDDDNNGNSSGNGNNEPNPGETLELLLSLKNFDTMTFDNVSATLSSNDEFINITSNNSGFGNIPSNSTADATTPYVINIEQDAPDNHQAEMILTITDNASNTWERKFWISIMGNDLDIEDVIVVDNNNQILDPGETVELRFNLKNNGHTNLTDVMGTLSSENDFITINDISAEFGTINIGQQAICTADAFEVEANGILLPGMKIPFTLQLFNTIGYNEIIEIDIEIGQHTINDPLGPDSYGYVCYDDGDIGYNETPEYNWIEINPLFGGNGTNTGISDNGDEQDDLATIDLPFTFNFYGEPYDVTTICSNGFIVFGETEQSTFRNWHLPGPLGPNPMIAAFWDNLVTSGNGGVYTYYDSGNHTFIIEWSNCKNIVNNNVETFQIILYDPAFYQTPTFDGKIKIQYKEFHNTDNGGGGHPHGCYSSIGLEDHTGGVGLEYTFDNDYPTAARQLGNETAILFTIAPTTNENPYLTLYDTTIFDSDQDGILEAGETIEIGAYIENIGEGTAENITAYLSSNDPYITIINGVSTYPNIEGSQIEINHDFFTFEISPNVEDEHIIEVSVNLVSDNGGWVYPLEFVVKKPFIEYHSFYINDKNENNNNIADPGETVAITVNISNNSDVEMVGAQYLLNSNNPNVTIVENSFTSGVILPEHIYQVPFDVEFGNSLEIGEVVIINLEVAMPSGDLIEEELYVKIGFTSYNTDFEEDNGNFLSEPVWEWGVPGIGAYSGSKCWGTSLNGYYQSNSSISIQSPEVSVGDNPELHFFHFYNVHEGTDGGNVKVSTDAGTTWNIIEPVGGYPVASIDPGNVGIPNEPAYSGVSSGWEEAVFDLSDYANEDLTFRWHFGSNQSIVSIGWYIDLVEVLGVAQNTGTISGNMEVLNGVANLSDAMIFANDFTIAPKENGDYTFCLPQGDTDFHAYLPFYEVNAYENINVEIGTNLDEYNFEFSEFNSPTNLGYGISGEEATLNWNYQSENVGRNSKENSRATFSYFEVYQQIECSYFTRIDSTTEMTSLVNIEPGYDYRYYVRAVYEEGYSNISNVITINLDNPYQYGDTDSNGSVQSFDASVTLMYSIGLDPLPQIDPLPWEDWRIIVADVDGNNTVQSFDASLILQYVVGLITQFPVETLDRFVAPTADVEIIVEDNTLVFVSKGELLGFDLSLENNNFISFGEAQLVENSFEMAENINESNYKIGLCRPQSDKERVTFLRIPFEILGDMQLDESLSIKMTINTDIVEKEISLLTLNNGEIQDYYVDEFYGNYPNPFNPETSFHFSVKENNTPVSIDIFNIKGQKIVELTNKTFEEGLHTIKWQGLDNKGNNVSSGVYFYKVKINKEVSNHKMLLLK